MSEDTIIGAAFEPERRTGSGGQRSQSQDQADAGERLFKIRAARTPGQRRSASTLINLRYAWRGYATKPLPQDAPPGRITLVAAEQEETIGTMTVGFDGKDGLMVEELFPGEVHSLRAEGHRVCEFTKLAIDGASQSKRVLATLFHVAYLYAYRVMGYDCLLIEVNPRHVNYYSRILGFTVLASSRMNLRVNAPAVLMCLDFAHTQEQIARFGGQPQFSATERSLYPYSFSQEEEAGIVARIRRGDHRMAQAHYTAWPAAEGAAMHASM
ncbi:N-acyl amino acid synthase FeeM domain-containing protein [Scleromatobacter humisilvae]|uniref:Long-chain N-acyl amino acid synthase n=1 Tax=Scleromatobacter humisilvae TaxID=2897159 RepID=A0A9X1YI54_9BURK|nr:long-chain N-acyl amino acid synthase [Scleromatobacter humisilvae]MCK9686336.1 long-chain N-acyl amino acid synthase [Scleromatobacter humisilvae]